MSTIPFTTANFSVKPDTDQSLGGIGIGSTTLGLNLGHRTYFSSGEASAIDRLFARSRGVYSLSHQPPRCQAEGCKADLSIAKHYHKRHKVCEFHSKATIVIAGGLQQRFCQQCSRFHVLSEFDESKRSCRKRLADHNRRRRKPQPQKNKQVMISTTENTMRMEGQEGYKKKGVFGFDFEFESSNLYQNQVSFVSQQQQQQQQQQHQEKFFSSPNSTSLLHDHNLFCSTSSGGSEQQDEHHQAMFEVEFM
ncbi:hypothetical protein J5N97_002561 [Dioscorea zingiberensis]|uniref:SBP-type domain-containing protein n=1 Tax=Dioscorea zingiberensis TaxID=325984 RepID=A0A9D5D506_9LILI|nr:hypothetical protein J5N97_002561 [Dioscorea zingiberensis]